LTSPAARLETLRLAGELAVPFTTGILIGIWETRDERIEALLAIRDLDDRYGHVQEVIVQNFRAKPGTRMAGRPEPSLEELLWSCAVARLVLGPEMSVQAPPNLSYDEFPRLLDAGINDWGGVSPVTIDHVNPEAPWPELARLGRATRRRGLELAPRLPLYPAYVAELERWCEPAVATAVRHRADASGLARDDRWAAGEADGVPGAVNGIVTQPLYLDVTLPPGLRFEQALPTGHTAFVYVFEGEATFGVTDGEPGTLLRPSQLGVLGEGEGVAAATAGSPVRFLLLAAQPLREPVARYGPFVMNTRDEIHQAVRDFQSGTFLD
jgi:hypothetical protein